MSGRIASACPSLAWVVSSSVPLLIDLRSVAAAPDPTISGPAVGRATAHHGRALRRFSETKRCTKCGREHRAGTQAQIMSRMSSRRCTVRTRRSVRVPRHWYNTRVISQGRADCASLRRRRRSRGLSVRPTAQRPILRTRAVISAFVITASSSSVDRNATTDRTSRSNGGERRQALTSRRGERPFRAEGGTAEVCGDL